MREFLKDFLTQHRAERNGVFIIVVIISAVITYGVYNQYFASTVRYDHDSFKSEIAAFVGSKEIRKRDVPNYSKKSSKTKKEITYFKFNPNNLSKEKWVSLGFSEKQADVIKNYEAKSTGFKQKSDLKKLFVISDEKYEILKPWIDLPNEIKKEESFSYDEGNEKSEYTSVKVDSIEIDIELNSCDTSDLKKIRGIGSYYARKIIEYRNELGGFHSIDQLSEIWKMREETITALSPYVSIDTNLIKKININVVDAEILKAHPYLDWSEANSIVNMREQNGEYYSISDIKKSALIDEDKISQIKYYISIDD